MEFLRNNRFLIFLIFLISMFSISPFIETPVLSNLWATINYSLLLISGLFAFSNVRNFLKFTTVFFLIAIVVDWIEFFHPEGNLVSTIRPLITAPVLILLLILTLRSIFFARVTDKNVIFGALCGYILIGYIGTYLNLAISVLYPGSFNISGELTAMEATYYSFVTMTTLGFGEILPLSDQARAITISLSILGPMYVAILIAMLVGKYASRPDFESKS
jgi:hypothetical protein